MKYIFSHHFLQYQLLLFVFLFFQSLAVLYATREPTQNTAKTNQSTSSNESSNPLSAVTEEMDRVIYQILSEYRPKHIRERLLYFNKDGMAQEIIRLFNLHAKRKIYQLKLLSYLGLIQSTVGKNFLEEIYRKDQNSVYGLVAYKTLKAMGDTLLRFGPPSPQSAVMREQQKERGVREPKIQIPPNARILRD